MNKEELRALVAQLLRERELPEAASGAPLPAQEEILPDITQEDLREMYLVEHPQNAGAFLALKRKTPARLGLGRAGARYRTQTLLRFRADHAAAQDSVFSEVRADFAKEHGWIPVVTRCRDKDEYLTRPDLGRCFDEANAKILSEVCHGQKIVLAVGDGLSSAAIEANAPDCAAAICEGLKSFGLSVGKIPFIRFCRVGAGDHIGDLTGCELICLLVGERPGLVTNESMSAYLTYRPHRGIAESMRTVVSNIHRQGVGAVEAGAHIAALIDSILKQRASGVARGETP